MDADAQIASEWEKATKAGIVGNEKRTSGPQGRLFHMQGTPTLKNCCNIILHKFEILSIIRY